MTSKPFERTLIHPREKPLSDDINRMQTQESYSQRALEVYQTGKRISLSNDRLATAEGFIGSGFKARALGTPAMTVKLDYGVGIVNSSAAPATVDGCLGADDLFYQKMLVLGGLQVIDSIPVPTTGMGRYDIIEVKVRCEATDPEVREIFDPTTETFLPGNVNKTLGVDLYGLVSISGSSYINYKMGAESATPTYATDVPAVTAGYKKIAEVFIPTTGLGHSAIYANQIIDKRTLLAPGGMFSVSGTVALDAGTGIASLVDLVAPPGVCVATYFVPAGGGSPAQILVYIILGDHETSGGVYPRAVGSMHCTTPVSTTDLYVARAAMLNAAVNSTTQGYMATAVPPVAVAVYQPTLVLNAAIVHQAAGVTDASIPAGTSGWAFSVNIGV